MEEKNAYVANVVQCAPSVQMNVCKGKEVIRRKAIRRALRHVGGYESSVSFLRFIHRFDGLEKQVKALFRRQRASISLGESIDSCLQRIERILEEKYEGNLCDGVRIHDELEEIKGYMGEIYEHVRKYWPRIGSLDDHDEKMKDLIDSAGRIEDGVCELIAHKNENVSLDVQLTSLKVSLNRFSAMLTQMNHRVGSFPFTREHCP